MGNLIINRIKYTLDSIPKIYVSALSSLLFSVNSNTLKRQLSESPSINLYKDWCAKNGIEENSTVYYDFSPPQNGAYIEIEPTNYFKVKYVRFVLIQYFINNAFLIDEYPKTYDLSLYKKDGPYNAIWGKYSRYDILIKPKTQEISFSIGSNQTLISNEPYAVDTDHIKGVSTTGVTESGKLP